MAPPARSTWYSRAAATMRGWSRAFRLPTLRRPPARPGVTVGRIGSARGAEDDLASMASSPVVFAAVNRRAWGLASYPIRCYWGSQESGIVLDPNRVPWVAALQRLLQTPDAADLDVVFPTHPGEGVLAQVVADLLQAGNAYVAITTGPSGAITSLHRLHPKLVSLERTPSGDVYVYRAGYGAAAQTYPRGSVSHLRLLSFQAGGQGELGVGAGTPLRPLVAAESEALAQTAASIGQGGPDIMVTGADMAAQAYLENQVNREAISARFAEGLMPGPDGGRRRAFVLGGNLRVDKASWDPADLKAPELLAASRAAELMALGVTPISVGADAGTYATAVQQYRVQAEWDEQLQMVIEAYLLRPLARHFARQAGGRWAMRLDQVTCRVDLSTHPGYAYLRADALKRMRDLVDLGWSAEQAAEAEGMGLPKPEGKPRQQAGMQAGAAPQPTAGEGGSPPRRPLGDTDSSPADPGAGEGEATPGRVLLLSEWLRERTAAPAEELPLLALADLLSDEGEQGA